MTDHVRRTSEGGVVELRFARPEKKNAITAAMYAALADALRSAEVDPDVRAVLFTAEGGAFTAGNDLQDFLAAPPSGDDAPVWRFLHAISSHPKPVVAAVGGLAVGVGTTLLLHCDLVVASETAAFQTPFVDLGLVPEAASSLLLPRLVGRHRAAEFLMLGERFDAATALALGLVNRVVPADMVDESGRALARRLAEKPPEAMRLTKRLMRSDPAEIAARMKEEGALFAERLLSDEARAAFQAFLSRGRGKAESA